MSERTTVAVATASASRPALASRMRGRADTGVTRPRTVPFEERIVALDPRDARLLAEAGAAYPDVVYADCTHARLAEIAQRHGVEFATAFFYDRVRRAPATRAFLDCLDRPGPAATPREDATAPAKAPRAPLGRPDAAAVDAGAARVDAIDVSGPGAPRRRGRVLIAPGAFYREHPRYGSDGRVVRDAASALGLAVELLPAASLGTVCENAAAIRRRLAILDDRTSPRRDRHGQQEPVVLVSLSKGGADARLALEQMGAPPQALRAWINICGLIHGTPVADRAMADWWRRTGAGMYITLRGGNRELLRDITAAPGSLLAQRATAPHGVLVINVVGFPMRRHLFGITRWRHRFMAPRGPSDGLALLRDEIVEPGVTLPVWGTDHYFRLPGIPDALRRLFRYLDEGGWLHAHDARA